jgi:AraC-like DNA-binding protein
MDREPEESRGILAPAAGEARFTRALRDPHPSLAPWVDRHWTVRWHMAEGESFTQAILPSPCVNLSSEPGLVAIYGIPLERSLHTIEATGMVVGTKFLPGGFAPFCSIAASLLNGRIADPAEVLGPAGAGLRAELERVAGDVDAHIEAVEAFLLERRPEPDARYDLVRSAAELMLSMPPATAVAEIASRCGVAPRTLQRAFHDYVGVSPKWVLKRYRMLAAADRIAAGEGDDLARLAADLGYFDQAHFTGDFTTQIGRPPAEYARICAIAAGRPAPAAAG